MKEGMVVSGALAESVIAVPPLARHEDLSLQRAENQKLIEHIEHGGISTLMYGGNANFYNLALSEYADTLEFLVGAVGEETWLIPSAGPDYGRLVDQVPILRQLPFPTVMVLPLAGPVTPAGAATALRRFAEKLGRPIILYLKQSGYLTPESAGRLFREGLICGIKYAVVRKDPTEDDYLRRLLDQVEADYIVSGIGERPAVAHLRTFGLGSFTTGCGVIAPAASQALLDALKNQEYLRAEEIRRAFLPLEDWRDNIHPIRVLHEAVSLAGLASMGPILPLLDNLEEEHWPGVRQAAQALLNYDRALMAENVNA